jgi:hypothetical protein
MWLPTPESQRWMDVIARGSHSRRLLSCRLSSPALMFRDKSFAATREYLRSLTGSDFATEDEWWQSLDPNQVAKSFPNVARKRSTDPRLGLWMKATIKIDDLCITDRGQVHCPTRTVRILKQLTGQSFDSPAQWVQWWQDNRAYLALSADGRTLVSLKG